MSAEEKAKAYDEALKDMKAIYPNLKGDIKLAVEHAFPDLAESEDERTRKVLINIVKSACGKYGVKYRGDEISEEKLLAYLEKQKINTEGDFGRGYDCGYEACLNSHGAEWFEKQKEPHFTKRNALFDKCVENCDPKTVEEVNKRVDDIMNMPELSAFEQALTNFIGYWEDDEERWPSKFVKKHGKHILDMAREELQKEQKSAEWSEEDEETLKDIIAGLEATKQLTYRHEPSGRACYNKWIAWLKSLRPVSKESLQPHWKPSEEQMEALLKAVDKARELHYTSIDGYDGYNELRSLYEQIKKLM